MLPLTPDEMCEEESQLFHESKAFSSTGIVSRDDIRRRVEIEHQIAESGDVEEGLDDGIEPAGVANIPQSDWPVIYSYISSIITSSLPQPIQVISFHSSQTFC